MKSVALFAFLIITIAVSIYFTYERSFVWKNFDIVNSDEKSAEDAAVPAAVDDTASSTVEMTSTTTPVTAGAAGE